MKFKSVNNLFMTTLLVSWYYSFVEVNATNNTGVTKIRLQLLEAGVGVSYSISPSLTKSAPMNPIPYILTNLYLSYTGIAGGRVTISGLTGKYITNRLSVGIGFGISSTGIGITLEPKWNWTVLDSNTKTVYLPA